MDAAHGTSCCLLRLNNMPPTLHLVQHASGTPYEQMLMLSRERHAAYCKRHAIEYRVSLGRVDSVSIPMWGKVARVDEALAAASDGDIVLWLDADTLILDLDTSLHDATDDTHWFGAVRNNLDKRYNAGVFWIRANTAMRALWAAVREAGPTYRPDTGRWMDHYRINDAIDAIDAGGKNRVVAMDSRWNSYDHAGAPPTQPVVVRAWHGVTPRLDVLYWMRQAMQELQRVAG